MAIPLATAFVRVRADTSRLKPDVEKGMAGAGPAGAKAGAKAGDEFARAAKKRIIGVSKDITLGLAGAGVALAANGVRMAVQFQSDMKLLQPRFAVPGPVPHRVELLLARHHRAARPQAAQGRR